MELTIAKNATELYDKKFSTTYCIAFIAGPRTGHNAVANWLTAQCRGDSILFPCHSRTINGVRHPGVIFKTGDPGCSKEVRTYIMGNMIDRNYSDICDCHFDLTVYRNEWKFTTNDAPFQNNKIVPIYLIRDFRNQAASLIKGHKWIIEKFGADHLREGWLDYANLALNSNDLFIYYDRWFTDEDYRMALVDKMQSHFPVVKWQYNSKPLEKDYNNSSSFDPNKKANQRPVTERYKKMERNKIYKQMVTKEVLEVLEKIQEKFYG